MIIERHTDNYQAIFDLIDNKQYAVVSVKDKKVYINESVKNKVGYALPGKTAWETNYHAASIIVFGIAFIEDRPNTVLYIRKERDRYLFSYAEIYQDQTTARAMMQIHSKKQVYGFSEGTELVYTEMFKNDRRTN